MHDFRSPRRWSATLVALALAAGGISVTSPGAATAADSAANGADPSASSGAGRPRASLTIPESISVVGHSFTINTKGSKAPAGLRTLVISFGDGEHVTKHETSVRLRHRYQEAGTYTVRLTVTDGLGRRDRIAQNIVVTHASGALPPTEEVTGEALPQAGALPGRISLRKWAMPVQNQSPRNQVPSLGSCVSWAIGYAMMGWYYRHHYGQTVEFAPMYIYSQYHGGTEGGTVGGMQATKALDTLKVEGIDTRQHYGAGWAYDYTTRPQDAIKQNAANYRISGYHTLFAHPNTGASADERYLIQAALAAATPVAISIRLKSSFEDYESGTYRATGPVIGNHEMLAVGYNAKGLIVQNSWGTGWGRKGYVVLGWRAVRRDVYEADVIDGLVTPGATSDKVAPTVTAPANVIRSGTTTSGSGVPVTVSWQGSDDSGTVASYQLFAKNSSGEWAQQTLASPTATSVEFPLVPGNSYQFAVKAVDPAGNVSALAEGRLFTVADYDDDSGYVGYVGTWQPTAWAPADGGSLMSSSTPNSYATFSFVGSSVGWVAFAGSNRGQAYVYLDGTYQTTVDLYSATPISRYVALHGNWAANESHTLAIQVVGTAGRPTIDIDSFVLLY